VINVIKIVESLWLAYVDCHSGVSLYGFSVKAETYTQTAVGNAHAHSAVRCLSKGHVWSSQTHISCKVLCELYNSSFSALP